MSRLLLDGTLGAKLRTASDTVELVDEAGRVLGVYTPVRLHVPPPGFQFPISDEELDRRNKVRTGRSLDEIMTDLKAKHA
jgi:hypothetical protein